MWILSSVGFYSIVRKSDGMHVRARTLRDIRQLVSLCKLKHVPIRTPRADYLWRIVINASELDSILRKLGQIKYDNFKSEVGKTNARRMFLYHKAWELLQEIEEEENEEAAEALSPAGKNLRGY